MQAKCSYFGEQQLSGQKKTDPHSLFPKYLHLAMIYSLPHLQNNFSNVTIIVRLSLTTLLEITFTCTAYLTDLRLFHLSSHYAFT